MNEIFFPSQYKKALLNKTKNMTIRIGKEIGKYKPGRVYSAKSYACRNWGIKIKVDRVFSTTLNKLSQFDIPQRTVESIKNKEKISKNARVELIKFTSLSN